MVAAKFFPVDDPDGSYPLCERDYFARLDLICGQCDKALRGSYITACSQLKPLAEASFTSLLICRKSFAFPLDKKFHVEHFTCSACATVFGPQDSYYEHDDQVCEWHSPAQRHLSLGLIRRLFPRLPLPLLDAFCHQLCMLREFSSEAVRRDQSEPEG